MRSSRSRPLQLGRRLTASVCSAAALAAPVPVLGKAASAVITTSAPDGFGNLTDSQDVMADVYFGDVRISETMVRAAPGSVTLSDAAKIVNALPGVKDRAAVSAALSQPALPSNADAVCRTLADQAACGRLTPDIAGVIFDRERFRLDIFVNPRFLGAGPAHDDVYLPVPSHSISLLNSIGAVLSGQSSGEPTYYNIQNNLLLASGDRRLRADLSYASDDAITVDTLALEWDRRGFRYLAGALWASGGDLTARRKIVGVGVETQIDTRIDRDRLLGSPVVVFLDRRSRVDVLRDGRLIHSAIYDAGNQEIDTSDLPDGSYEIALRIQEPGGRSREERRFFSKSRRSPSAGRTDFFAFGGVEAQHLTGAVASRDPYVSVGIAHGLTERFALGASLEAARSDGAAEIDARFATPFAQFRAAALLRSDSTRGALLQVSSSGSSRLNFNFDLRRIDGPGNTRQAEPNLADFAFAPREPSRTLVDVGGYSQFGGVISYSVPDIRFLGTGFYRKDEGGEAHYSFGPSLEWDIVRRGSLVLTAHTDMTLTERGQAGFAGLSLRLIGGRSSLSSLVGMRHSTADEDRDRDGSVAAISAAFAPQLADADLNLGAAYDHEGRQESALISGDLRHPLGSLAGDFVRSTAGGETQNQFSLGLHTSIAAGSGMMSVGGHTTTQSMIVARVNGARPSDRFQVLVDEQVMGTILGNSPLALPLASYRLYNVRIRPVGGDLLSYDSGTRSAGLYPGTVTKLEWTAAPIAIQFGRLVAPDGSPIRNAAVTGKSLWSETDEQGFFQIEAPLAAELTVTTNDGRAFVVVLPRGDIESNVVRLGAIACCSVTPTRLGALDASSPEQRITTR